MPTLVVRPDARPGIGGGHLGRCLAVAQAWTRRHGRAVVAADLGGDWGRRYEASSVAPVGADSSTWPRCDAVLVDGYEFGPEVQAAAADAAPTGVVDDYGVLGSYGPVSFVVDQNIAADRALYRSGPAEALLGPEYAMLRDEIRHHLGAPLTEPPRRVAIAMGHDPSALVRATFEAAAELLAASIEVAWLSGIDDVGAFLARCDVVLTAGGTTTLDVLALGRPAVVVACASNQEPVARRCGQLGFAVDAGNIDAVAPVALADRVRELVADLPKRAALAAAGPRAVDGRGADRVAAQLRSLSVRLRPVTEADAELLFQWANDSDTRRNAFSGEPIEWGTHVAWLDRKLRDPNAHLFIGLDATGEIGHVRFDIDGGEAVISVSVAAERRGEGLAAPLIIAGVRGLFRVIDRGGCSQVIAEIKPTNSRSVTAFSLAGFRFASEHDEEGRQWHSYARGRDG